MRALSARTPGSAGFSFKAAAASGAMSPLSQPIMSAIRAISASACAAVIGEIGASSIATPCL
jgi:hypothetical protein